MPLSQEDKDYEQLVWLLHSLTYALTARFRRDKGSRAVILAKLTKLASEMFSGGCPDDLCYNKEKGCIPCDYQT